MRQIRELVILATTCGLLAACSTETDLTVHTVGENAEGETVPLSNVSLDVIPYDIDELYTELEQETQPGPAPAADSIRLLSQQYQDACAAYRATSDSIETVRERATQIARQTGETSPEYNQAFQQYQQLVALEEERFARCQEVTDTYTAIRNRYREERRGWEERAWPEGRFASAESVRMGGLRAQRIETGPQGYATVTVPNGTWWLLGTAPVPGSISQQYRWNLQIDAAGGRDTVQLTGENATLEPVY